MSMVRWATGGWPYHTTAAARSEAPLALPIDWETKPGEQVATLHREMAVGMGFQYQELTGFDQKVSLLFTTIGVLLGLGLAGASSLGTSSLAHGFFATGLLLLVIGLVTGIAGYRPRHVEAVPSPAGLFPASIDDSSNLILGSEIEGMAIAFTENQTVRGVKLAYLTLTLRLLVFGAALLALGYGTGISGTLR